MRLLTLQDLWRIFVRQIWVLILSAAIVVVGMFLVVQLTYEPSYASTATLYILRQEDGAANSSSDDFSLALKVVEDCGYLLKSHSVLDQVIADLGLDFTYPELSACITTSNPANTRILEVTVQSPSPLLSKEIVDRVCIVGTEKITEAMGFQQVNLYEYGVEDPTPCNTVPPLAYGIAALVTLVAVYTACLVAFLLDDRIRSAEDIERYLGLVSLGNIPAADAEGSREAKEGKTEGVMG